MLLLYNKSGIYHTKNCAGYYDKVLVPQSSDAPFLRGVISLYRKIQIQEDPQCFHTGLVLT